MPDTDLAAAAAEMCGLKDFCPHCQELTNQQPREYADCTLIVCQRCGTAVDRVWKKDFVEDGTDDQPDPAP